MATTKIWSIHDSLGRVVDYAENPEKTENPDYTERELQGLYDVMNYATSNRKTEQKYFVSGVNCIPESARQQMMMTKQQFGKEGGIVAFHAYQSFLPGEVTPDVAHRIGIELAGKLWGNQFQVVVATHLNTNCVHNHFVLNSVSFVDGKRYNDCKRTYRLFRATSDRICAAFGLSVIENPKPTRTPRSIYFAGKAGRPTTYTIMMADMDAAIRRSLSLQHFVDSLRAMGYIVSNDPKRMYATIKMPRAKHPTRFKTLGEDYTVEAIKRRIRDNRHLERDRRPPAAPVKAYHLFGSFQSGRKMTGLRALYLHYCYRLGVIPKKNPQRPTHPALKADLLYIRQISDQTKLLCTHKIDTQEQLETFISKTKETIHDLTAGRTAIYNKLRRCEDEEKIAAYKAERDKLSEQIADLRKEAKTAEGVMARSVRMKENLTAARTSNMPQQKTRQLHERQR